jgi:hypothetical protein
MYLFTAFRYKQPDVTDTEAESRVSKEIKALILDLNRNLNES